MTSKTNPETGAKGRLDGGWRGPFLILVLRIAFLSAITGGILTLFGVQLIDVAAFLARLRRIVNDLGFAAFGAAAKIIVPADDYRGPALLASVIGQMADTRKISAVTSA